MCIRDRTSGASRGPSTTSSPGWASDSRARWAGSVSLTANSSAAAHPAAITRLEFSRRGLLLASGDMAGNVRIWDFASRKLFAKQIASQGRAIIHLAFDRLGERLAVAADEKCVRVWHIDTGKQLAILELSLGVPNVVRFSQDGNCLLYTSRCV